MVVDIMVVNIISIRDLRHDNIPLTFLSAYPMVRIYLKCKRTFAGCGVVISCPSQNLIHEINEIKTEWHVS